MCHEFLIEHFEDMLEHLCALKWTKIRNLKSVNNFLTNICVLSKFFAPVSNFTAISNKPNLFDILIKYLLLLINPPSLNFTSNIFTLVPVLSELKGQLSAPDKV